LSKYYPIVKKAVRTLSHSPLTLMKYFLWKKKLIHWQVKCFSLLSLWILAYFLSQSTWNVGQLIKIVLYYICTFVLLTCATLSKLYKKNVV